MRSLSVEAITDTMEAKISLQSGRPEKASEEDDLGYPESEGLIPVEQDDVKHYTIILMGLTGTGKSSFISLLKGEDIGIGHDLESYTTRSKEYEVQLDPERVVHLIDTPGFNDSTLKDCDILREVAFFLNKIYEERIELNGIIFLHRIIDQRMSGASLRNLHILQKLAGQSATSHIALTSTMWSKLEHQSLGDAREKELLQNANFWAPLKTGGAIITRHDGSAGSARDIVEALIQRGTTVLDIQRQLVDEKLSLDETTAGLYLQHEMLEAKKMHEKELAELEDALKEAVEDNDQGLIEALTEQRESRAKLLSQTHAEQQELRLSSKSLDPERSKVLADLKAQLAEDERKRDDEISALKAQIEALQDDLVDTQVGRSRDMSRALRDRENLIVHNKRLEHSAIMQQQTSEHQRRALLAQLALRQDELQAQRRRAKSKGTGSFFSELFMYDDAYYDDGRAHGHRRRLESSRHQSNGVQRRSTEPAPYQALSQRTFRTQGPGYERRYC